MLFSIFEFLYQSFSFLGYRHPSIPAYLPKRLVALAGSDIPDDCKVYWKTLIEVLEITAQPCPAVSSFDFLSEGIDPLDERNNATVGGVLNIMTSAGSPLAGRSSTVLMDALGNAASRWRPLSQESISTMEYLVSISLGKSLPSVPPRLTAINAADVGALSGLLLARSRRYNDATKVLEKAAKDVQLDYGITSMQYGIVVAEMANCYNMLRKESLAETWVRATLEASTPSGEFLDRPDQFYLLLALADSFIGRGKYHEALPLLQGLLENPHASDTIRMISALRLAKSHRRVHQDAMAFEPNKPLTVVLPLFNRVPDQLQMEYLEELACNLSAQSGISTKMSRNSQETIQLVNRMLKDHLAQSTTESPGLLWYRQARQQSLDDAIESSMMALTKPADELEAVERSRQKSAPETVSIHKSTVSSQQLSIPVMHVGFQQQRGLLSQEAKERSRAIDSTIAQEWRLRMRDYNVLVMGSRSRSEVVNRLKIVDEGDFSNDELPNYRSDVFSTIVNRAKNIVRALELLDIAPVSVTNQKYIELIAEYRLDLNIALPLSQDFCDALCAVWSDGCIENLKTRQTDLDLGDTLGDTTE